MCVYIVELNYILNGSIKTEKIFFFNENLFIHMQLINFVFILLLRNRNNL